MIVFLNMLETEADKVAFQKFYEETNKMLFGHAINLLKNEADAEDAVQTCFLKIAEKYEKYRGQSKDNMVRLSCTIVRHVAIDMLREKDWKNKFADETYAWEDSVVDEAPDILDQLIKKIDQNLLTKAIMQLPEEERNYLYLRYILNLKPKNIGELFNMKASAIRKKLYQCRAKLAVILEGDEYECLR